MTAHFEPRQCLANLLQQESDGGRAEYIEQERRRTRSEPELPTGDCAVVAVVHASFQPEKGEPYREARQNLLMSNRPWMYRRRLFGKSPLAFLLWRLKQWEKPPNRDPVHGTPSFATAWWLRLLGYQHIYPNEKELWHCICDNACTYVLDIGIPGGHTITVHQRVAHTTSPFDPEQTEVGNVYRLNPKKTRHFKGMAEYKKAEDLWWRQFTDSGGLQLPDWETHPKLGDFLR